MLKKTIKPILVYCLNLASHLLKPKRRIRKIKSILKRLLQLIAGQDPIQKARQAMERQNWSAACKLWAKVRRRKPTELIGYAEGAKTLLHCQREDEAAKLLLKWFKKYGALDRNTCTTAVMIITNHAVSPILSYRIFRELVHQLVKSDVGNHMLFNMLFSIASNVNWHKQPHEYASFRSQLKQVWSEIPQDDDNAFWFGLALGFIDEDLTAPQVKHLLLLELSKLGWLLCEHPFHTKTIASFRAYAQALTDKPVPNNLPEASRKKLGVLLAAIDYNLLNQLRHKLLPTTKQASTRSDTVRPNHKLRIAVCVSGQLRGYQQAFASWHNLGLENHDVDYFAHVWQRIGRKIPHTPIKIQLQRLFTDAFCDIYADALKRYGLHELERTYPGFFRFFTAGGDCVTQAELQQFYRTDAVVIEDDALSPFCEFDNPKKMYYKAEQAYKLATASDKDYDLIIRIRPDKGMLPPDAPVDWRKVYENCERNGVVFADGAMYLVGNLSIPDQVACGSVYGMEVYSTTFSRTNSGQGLIAEYVNPRFQPHRNFAYALLEAGFNAKPLSEAGVKCGTLLDPARLTASETKMLLQQDINKRKRHELDAVFLAALEKDLTAER